MRKIGSAVVVAAALVFAAPAGAQVALDLKVGYAIPTGNSTSFGGIAEYWGPMNHIWSGAIPIEVAGRYRFSPSFSVGVYFQYNPASIASYSCSPGLTCSGYDMRTGVEAVYGFLPERFLNPWVSLGSGWQWTHASISDGVLSNAFTLSGWEYFNVQVGLDFNLSRMFAVGPYVGYFGGQYTSKTASISDFNESGSIASEFRAFHGWLQFGVKGTVNL